MLVYCHKPQDPQIVHFAYVISKTGYVIITGFHCYNPIVKSCIVVRVSINGSTEPYDTCLQETHAPSNISA